MARMATTTERLRLPQHPTIYQRCRRICCMSIVFDSCVRWLARVLLPWRILEVRAEVDPNAPKLHLVLDLDNTLIHSALPNALREGDYLRKDIFLAGRHVTKLRPFLREFLLEASRMFEMSIYTLGTREYARHIAGLIDPLGLYFGDRVISREDSTVMRRKSLNFVRAPKSRVIIVDDKRSIWPWDGANVIEIEPYHYFATEGKEGKEEEGRALLALLRRLRRIHRRYSAGKEDVRVLLNTIRH